MMNDITGIILAGGRSSRMGEDKAFLSFSGKPMIETIIDKLSPLFGDLIIIANKPRLYQKYGIEVHGDILKDLGPLGGIYTGLVVSRTVDNFIIACDMPYINPDLIRYMLNEKDNYDAVIAERGGRLQPLCAVYSKNCIKPIEKELRKKNLKMTAFLEHVNVKIINENKAAEFDPDGRFFANINTKEDYQCVLQASLKK